jgi:mono/diheme cytochrome c family protein
VARPLLRLRDKSKLAALGLVLVGVVALGGCDLQEDADLDRGRELFISKCGTCHTLAEAATTAETGPDLDAAFAGARANGEDQDTIEGVVEYQIESPRPAEPEQTDVYMPAGLVEGSDAEDVAAYVASVAGIPGIEPPIAPGGPGGQVFAQNGCASCHTLEAAGSTGTAGPSLDEAIPGQDPAQVEQSIVEPGAEIVPGFDDIMPAVYGEQIAPEDLKLLVDFLLNCAGNPENKGCS